MRQAPGLKQPAHVVSKKERFWDGISLAHYRLRQGEIAARHSARHLVTLSLGDRCHGEIRTPNGFRTQGQTRGSVCVIPAGQSYTARVEGESDHLVMLLEPSLVLRAAAESRVPNDVAIVEKCAPSDDVISSVGMALLAETESEGVAGRLYAESLANVLAVHLLRHYATAAHRPQRLVGGLTGHRLRQILDFIRDHYDEDLSLAELAQVAGMSTFHFAREFKRTTGTSPHQYLMRFRVERAKELLARSQMPLVDVGFRAGFSHQSHFTRLFRRLTGTTPQSYRLMLQT
jgi:AraC family transcriptional regulator